MGRITEEEIEKVVSEIFSYDESDSLYELQFNMDVIELVNDAKSASRTRVRSYERLKRVNLLLKKMHEASAFGRNKNEDYMRGEEEVFARKGLDGDLLYYIQHEDASCESFTFLSCIRKAK